MTQPSILIEQHNGIATVLLNRPQARNALTFEMYQGLIHALREADSNPDVQVVLLAGAEDYFTSGNDLGDFIGYKKGGEFIALTFLKAITAFSKPIVAAVERGAVGVGATMLQHCDFVYAGRGTRFSLPFINFGLCAEGGASLLMAQGSNAKQAARWLMLGEAFTAQDALSAGLITEVVDDLTALAAARQTAERLTQLSGAGLRETKALIRRAQPQLISTLEAEIDRFTSLLEAPEAQQTLINFTQRTR